MLPYWYLLKPIANKCVTKSKVASQDKLGERHNLQVMFGGILLSQDGRFKIPGVEWIFFSSTTNKTLITFKLRL